jgi:hypothetical protein
MPGVHNRMEQTGLHPAAHAERYRAEQSLAHLAG